MASRLRAHLPALAGALLGAAALAWLSLYGFAWTDYDDEASAAFKALADGHLLRFLQLSPSYGGSMVIRAPFAALPALWGGGELAVYRAEAVPGIAAAVALALWLAPRMRADGLSMLARVTAVALCVCSPIAIKALEIGHPEELLGAVLCVAAVLAARRGRMTWAGVLLGLALANKAGAVVAVGPRLLALPARQGRAPAGAGGTGAVVVPPPGPSGARGRRGRGAPGPWRARGRRSCSRRGPSRGRGSSRPAPPASAGRARSSRPRRPGGSSASPAWCGEATGRSSPGSASRRR